MLKSAQQPTHAVFVLVPALLVFFTVALAQLFAIPPHATSYVSDEDAVTAFVTARPAELGDRCVCTQHMIFSCTSLRRPIFFFSHV